MGMMSQPSWLVQTWVTCLMKYPASIHSTSSVLKSSTTRPTSHVLLVMPNIYLKDTLGSLFCTCFEVCLLMCRIRSGPVVHSYTGKSSGDDCCGHFLSTRAVGGHEEATLRVVEELSRVTACSFYSLTC